MQLKTQKGLTFYINGWYFFYKEMPLFKDKGTYILYLYIKKTTLQMSAWKLYSY
jgi:hypothetical protein